MAKELIYKVRIDYDASSASAGGNAIERSQEDAQNAVNETTQAIRRQQEAQESTTQSTRNYNRAQSNANQVLFSYGDLLNDAQQFQFGFSNGLRAIGNNVGFAAEGIANLNQRAGGFRGTLSALGSSLLGPGGIILAINLAVTAFTVFGDKLFGDSDSVAAKAEKAREEIKKTREEIDQFSLQFEELTRIQEQAFPEIGEQQQLQQQLQFSRELEGNLQNRLDAQTEQVEKLERQVSLFEDLQDGSLTATEAFREGLISQQLAEAIAQDRVDVEGTLIRFQNQLNDAKVEQASLEQSVQSAQERQVNLGARLQSISAARETSTFKALENLTRQKEQLESILSVQEIDIQTAGGGIISPEEQAANEERRRQLEETRKQLNELATRTAPKVQQSIDEIALRGIEAGRGVQKGFKGVDEVLARAGAQAIIAANNIQEAGRAIINTVIAEIVAYAIRSAIRDLPFPGNLLAAVGAAAAGRGLAELIPDPSSNNRGGGGGGGSISVGSVGGGRSPQSIQSRSPSTNRIQGVQSRQQSPQPIVIQGDVNAMGAAFTVRKGEAQIRSQQRTN